MLSPQIKIIGLTGIPEIRQGDSLGAIVAQAARRAAVGVVAHDVYVIAQKIVSKAEGRTVDLRTVKPSETARLWAEGAAKDARLVEVVLRESRRVVRMDRGRLIVESLGGHICANAGVDASNAAPDTVTLLPRDCDRSARRIREHLMKEFGVPLAVIVCDSFGRPWRNGLANVALGVAGLSPLLDCRGQPDRAGRPLRSTVIAVADELAAAAELIMGKTRGIPVAVIRGAHYTASDGGSGRQLLRGPENDLFR